MQPVCHSDGNTGVLVDTNALLGQVFNESLQNACIHNSINTNSDTSNVAGSRACRYGGVSLAFLTALLVARHFALKGFTR